MNPFDLKAALLAKHAQHPVINPRAHGVEHGSNVWLTNSKLLPSRVCARKGCYQLFASDLFSFRHNPGNMTRHFESEDMHAGVTAFLETTI
jgi:hypothetical protein